MPVGASACLTHLPYSARLLGPDVSTRARVVGGVGSGFKIQDPRSKIQDRTLAPFRDPQLDPQYLLVRQLGIRFDELTRASFPQDLIHIILTQAKEAGAEMLYFMRVKLPGWMVVIAPGGSPYTNPNVTHRAYETDCLPHRFFSTTRINTRGDRLVSRKPILGPGY